MILSGRSLGGRREYCFSFGIPSGGLNFEAEETALPKGQTGKMKNLIYENGALRCRPGQEVFIPREKFACEGVPICISPEDYRGFGFCHMGTGLFAFPLRGENNPPDPVLLLSGLPETEGSFFPYRDKYYYKTKGRFIEISLSSSGLPLASPVRAHIPLVFINCDPSSGSGTLSRQPNLLTGARRAGYSVTGENSVFRLPEEKVRSLIYVKLDGEELTEGRDYAFNSSKGELVFPSPPPAPEPFEANTLEVCYTVPGEKDYEAIMDCTFAAAIGPCIVLGGEERYFWNGCDDAFSPGYFPAAQYNLLPFGSGRISAMLPRQDKLFIFSDSSLSKAEIKTASPEGLVSLDPIPVSSSLGCLGRGGAALAGGEIMFADKRFGLYSVGPTSPAGENSLRLLSSRVNKKLLPLLREGEKLCTTYDGRRLWLCATGRVYSYDLALDAWFYFEGIYSLGFLKAGDGLYSLTQDGDIARLCTGLYTDFGKAILREVRLPAFTLRGSFFSVSGFGAELSPHSHGEVKYLFEGGERREPCPLNAEGYMLFPRNLKRRCLRPLNFPKAFIRQPRVLKTALFSAELHCRKAASDLGLISSYILYVPLEKLK